MTGINSDSITDTLAVEAWCWLLRGQVQGIGMRPAIVRLAHALGVAGSVLNRGDGVEVIAQGPVAVLEAFAQALPSAVPAAARVDAWDYTVCEVMSERVDFVQTTSMQPLAVRGVPDLPADAGVCDACRDELHTPGHRRFAYPMIGCAACGPRYAVLQRLPFARATTTYSAYLMCADCERDSLDPDNRRFGAEFTSCPSCGPTLAWRDMNAGVMAPDPLAAAVAALRDGGIIAVKGMTGFHLMCRASCVPAVERLRHLKARIRKPFALLVSDSEAANAIAEVTPAASVWLMHPARPIVLLPRRGAGALPGVAPEQSRLGVMLPCTGVQCLLAGAIGEPLVATSANRRGEPVPFCLDEVTHWLAHGVAGVLDHDLAIIQPQDDSVIEVLDDGPLMLRRARGFVHEVLPADVLTGALTGEGAWFKTTLAIAAGGRALVSQPLGDRDDLAVDARRSQVRAALGRLTGDVPAYACHDAHPDLCVDAGSVAVFHHRAHLAALLADHAGQAPQAVAVWDGYGHGETGQGWGSQVFVDGAEGWRVAMGLRSFALPGGDRTSREPWRVAADLLLSAGVAQASVMAWLDGFGESVSGAVRLCVPAPSGSMRCNSLGRWFEALSCLIRRDADNHHEGDAAGLLQSLADGASSEVNLPPLMAEADTWDWRALVLAVWNHHHAGTPPALLARGVHAVLAEALVQWCRAHGIIRLGVTGGCFQNRLLLQTLFAKAHAAGIRVIRHQRLAPNDENIAYGQLHHARVMPANGVKQER